MLSEDVFNTSWSMQLYICLNYILYISIRLKNAIKMSCIGVFKRSSKTSSRYIIKLNCSYWNVFKTFSSCFKDVFNTFLRWTAKVIIYGKNSLDHTSEKFMFMIQILKNEFFGYTETFRTVFLKALKWLLLKIKIFLSKSGIRKDVAVSVNMNKESMNKSSSENVFLRF